MIYRLLAIAFGLVLFCTGLEAQQPTSPAPKTSGAVGATIVIFPDPSGQEGITFALSGVVPREEMARRFQAMLQYGGWKGQLLRVRSGVSRQSFLGTPLPAGTDALGITQGMVDRQRGGFNLEPIIRAFADVKRFHIYVLMKDPLNYRGITEWKTDALHIRLEQSPDVYHFTVDVLEPSGDLRVPTGAPSVLDTARARGSLILLWLVISLAAGILTALLIKLVFRRGV